MDGWWQQWDGLDEGTLTLVSAAPGMTSLSTMVCVKPRHEEAEALADPNGDPSDTLHVTLAYIGDYEDELEQIADALRIVAATHAPLEGMVGGYGIFAGADGQPWPAILLPDVPGLVELRVDATAALVRAGIDYPRAHGFAAHITLKYVEGVSPQDGPFRPDQAGAPLHFDELLIVRGDTEILALPLTGAKPLTAAGGALVAAGEPFCLPAELRGRTDPIRQAFVKAVMTPALEQAGLTWDITNPLAADVISRAGSHVVGIAQTTQDDLMNVINVAHSEGLSIPDTAKAIRSHMTEASNVRATMIARTELAAAVNGGSLAATKIAADATGATATKSWMTAPGAMYPRHEDYDGLDGQTVGLDEEFDVGGAPLQYPGDPDGDPGETINCRCTLEYSGDSSDLAGDNIDAAGEKRFSFEHHNRLLRAAYARVDELEPKLAAILQPILERAGEVAARRFEELATNHLTAADGAGITPDWTPPAAEEILPVNCEANAGARGITSGNAEAGLEPFPAPTAGPGPGRPVVSFAETTDYEEFNAALAENARPGFLTIHTPEELARDKVFISPDGASGFVVSPEHDLQNVFRNPDGVPGAGRAAVRMGVQQEGALTLDAYDGFLPDLYQKEGFGVVGRMKFVDEYAPDGWRFDEYGHPDILFMAQNPDPAFEIKTFTDWDEAKAYSLAAAREPISPEILDTADAMVSHAAELEPATTEELSAIAKDVGGEMSGLDFAVKGQPSLVRKISGDLADVRIKNPGATVQEVAGSINDTLRYTMTFSEGDYSQGVEQAIARLEKDGYKQVKLKNYWGNADYQGINGVFEKDGYRFELQFHTPDSFELKTTLHAPYEAYRLPGASDADKLSAWNTMSAEQSKIGVPPNVMGIGEKVEHPPPVGAEPRPLQSPDQLVVNTTSTLDPGGKDIDAALSSISQQIQLPDDVAQIEAKIVGDPVIGGARVEGYFTPVAKPGEQKQIIVRRLSERYPVFTHEFGHALDNALAAEGQMFATQDVVGNGLVDWLDSVQSSQAVTNIADALEQSAATIREAGGVPAAKDLVYVNGEPYYRASLEYAINPQELWARSFVQWRAAVDPKIAEHVAERLATTRPEVGFWYWQHIDFEPIATAMHEFLAAKDSLSS